EYEVQSEDLSYNTKTEIVKFFSLSQVVNENSILVTKGGVYNSKTGRGDFDKRTSILNNAQYVEANKLIYDKQKGSGKAFGNVIVLDTAQRMTLWSDSAFLNEWESSVLAIGN